MCDFIFDLFFKIGKLVLNRGFLLDNNGFDFLSFGEISLKCFFIVLKLFELVLSRN